jgi:hypothetical protein
MMLLNMAWSHPQLMGLCSWDRSTQLGSGAQHHAGNLADWYRAFK